MDHNIILPSGYQLYQSPEKLMTILVWSVHKACCVSNFSYRILFVPPPRVRTPREPPGPAAADLWGGIDPALLWPWQCSAQCRCPCTYLLHISCPENTMFGSWDKICCLTFSPTALNLILITETYSLSSMEFVLQRVDFLLQVLDLRLLHSQHHLDKIERRICEKPGSHI